MDVLLVRSPTDLPAAECYAESMRANGVRQHHSSINGVESTSAATTHVFPRHTHDHYGIGVMLAGGHRSHSGVGLVDAGPGDTIMVNPGEVHSGWPLGDTERAWRMLYFDPALLTSASDDIVQSGSRQIELLRPVVDDGTLATLFHALFVVATNPAAGASTLIRDQSCALMLTHLLQHHSTMTSARAVAPSIARARARIDDDPAADVSLGDLAATAGLSRFQVLRGFSRELGLTPHAYLVQRRLALARRLIADGVGLARVATVAGFADQSHLTRTFVRHLGITPGEFARVACPRSR